MTTTGGTMLCVWAGLAAASAVPPPPGPAPEVVRVEARAGGVAGVTEGGERWQIRHGWLAAEPGRVVAGPVTQGGRAFYGVHHDLIEVDPATGTVARRTAFPAPIQAIAEAGGGALDVTVRSEGFPSREHVDTVIRHRPGQPAPGRNSWGTVRWGAPMRDATALVPGFSFTRPPERKLEPAERDAAIDALAAAAAADQTNPFYPAARGVLLAGAGRAPDAQAAFDAAAAAPAPWSDLLRVSSILDDAGAAEAARRAFARGLEGMQAAGVRPERIRSFVAGILPAPREALRAAIEAGDSARVDELSERIWRVAPHAEGGAWEWARLAAWMKQKGKDELAGKWRARAKTGGTLFGVPPGTRDPAKHADDLLPLLHALAWSVPLAALLLGLRRGAAQRKLAKPRTGVMAWVPRPGVAGTVSLLAPLVLLPMVQVRIEGVVAGIGRYASAPLGAFTDGAGPAVAAWADKRLAPSKARDALVAEARAEVDAARAGGRAPDSKLDFDATLRAAIEEQGPPLHAWLRALHGDTVLSDEFGEDQPIQFVPGWWLSALLGVALLWLGFAVGKVFSPAAALARVIPGGARLLGPLGGLTAAAALYGYIGWRWPYPLSQIAVPSFAKFFGLEALPLAAPPVAITRPGWVYVALVSGILLHVAAVVVEARRNKPAG